MKKMKIIILMSITLLFNSACLTVGQGIMESKAECARLFNRVGISVTNNSDMQSKREYVQCVSHLTNARQNQTAANALSSLVIAQWGAIAFSVVTAILSTSKK